MRAVPKVRLATLARIALGGFGLWVLSIGARGLLKGHPFTANAPVGKWLLGGVVVHDALIAPVVFVLCAVAYRLASVRIRQALAAILLIGGSAFIVGLPDVLRKGHNSNPTVTPLDYTLDLVIVLSAVVGGVLLVTLAGAARARRRARPRVHSPTAELEPESEPESELESKAAEKPEPAETQEPSEAKHPMSGIEMFDREEP